MVPCRECSLREDVVCNAHCNLSASLLWRPMSVSTGYPFHPQIKFLCMQSQRSKTQVRVTSDEKSSLHLASSQSRDLLLFCDQSHVSFCEAPRLSTGSIKIHNDRPACPRPGPLQASLALVSRLEVGQLHQCQCCHRHPNGGQSDPLYGLALVAAPLLRPGNRYYDICRCREDPQTCYHTHFLSRNFRRQLVVLRSF